MRERGEADDALATMTLEHARGRLASNPTAAVAILEPLAATGGPPPRPGGCNV